jgi:hypothetical protein
MKLTRTDVIDVLSHAIDLASDSARDGNRKAMRYIPLESIFEVVVYVPGVGHDGETVKKDRVVSKGNAFLLDDLMELYNNL